YRKTRPGISRSLPGRRSRRRLFRTVLYLVRHRALPFRHRLRHPATSPPRAAAANRGSKTDPETGPAPPAPGGKSEEKTQHRKHQQPQPNLRLPYSVITRTLRSLIEKRAVSLKPYWR